MTYANITYETDERLAIITLNRPDRLNALSGTLCLEVMDAVARADRDPAIRVVIVTGEKAFSSGYDLLDNEEPYKTVSDIDKRHMQDFEFTMSVWRCSKPVIAMIDGYCLGGGLEFAQMCDMRYCSEGSSFGVVETRFATGVVTMIMPWILGARCRELIYTGDIIDAEEALRLGLVNRIFPKETLRDEVLKIARRMSRVAVECLRWNKRSINAAYDAQGIVGALKYGINAATSMNLEPSPEITQFNAILEEQGMKAALKWRKEQFAPYE